jgi:hypothetical protein
VICGTPKSVIPKIRKVLEVLRPGVFGFWQNDGPISAKDRTTSMRLIANEVLPAVREMGKELDLVSPFERAPGQRKLPATGISESVGSLEALTSYSFLFLLLTAAPGAKFSAGAGMFGGCE